MRGSRKPKPPRQAGKPLHNPKDEEFCQYRAAGFPVPIAYVRAGFSPNMAHTHAYKKGRHPAMVERIAEIQAVRAVKLDITVEKLTAELDATIELAWSEKQPAAAHAAIMGKAKLHGLITEKTENRNINVFADLSNEEIDFEIASMLTEFKTTHEKRQAIKKAN